MQNGQMIIKDTPVVTNLNGEILWVPGLPPAESYKITKLSRRVIHLTYH